MDRGAASFASVVNDPNRTFTDQLTRSFSRGKDGAASSAAFKASFICSICIIRLFLAGALLAIRANVSTKGRTAFRAFLISS
jgi:hypothetical protein